jgi:hypothetical protein
MSKCIKLAVFIFFAAFVFGFTYNNSIAAMVTPQDYIDTLNKLGKSNPEMLKTKERFIELPAEKKQRFMKYMTDPVVLKEILQAMCSQSKKVELYGGDIVVTNTETTEEIEASEYIEPKDFSDVLTSFLIEEAVAAPVVKDYKVTHQQEVKVLGLNINSVYNWVLYKSKNNKEVTQIISGGSYAHAAAPFYIIDKITEERYIFRNKAHNCVKYKYAPFVTPWTTTKVVHHDIIGNAAGGSSYRLWHS